MFFHPNLINDTPLVEIQEYQSVIKYLIYLIRNACAILTGSSPSSRLLITKNRSSHGVIIILTGLLLPLLAHGTTAFKPPRAGCAQPSVRSVIIMLAGLLLGPHCDDGRDGLWRLGRHVNRDQWLAVHYIFILKTGVC